MIDERGEAPQIIRRASSRILPDRSAIRWPAGGCGNSLPEPRAGDRREAGRIQELTRNCLGVIKGIGVNFRSGIWIAPMASEAHPAPGRQLNDGCVVIAEVVRSLERSE